MTDPERKPERQRGIIWGLMGAFWLLAISAVTAFSLAGYWGHHYWKLDNLVHFRMQYFTTASLLVLILFVRRRWILLLPALAVTLLNAYEIFNVPTGPSLWRTPALKAMSINVYSGNDDIERVVRYIEEENPDFIALIEVTGAWRSVFKELEERYPYQDIQIYGDNFGSALLSSHPMTEKKFAYAGPGSIAREVKTPSGNLVLLLVHPPAPMNEKAWTWRNRSMETIATFASEIEEPLLLLGDMNCSQWSPIFRNFLEESNLREPDTRILPRRTWPSGMPLAWIPIDHFLLSKQLTALDEWVGPSVGSDHYPIVLLFGFSAERD